MFDGESKKPKSSKDTAPGSKQPIPLNPQGSSKNEDKASSDKPPPQSETENIGAEIAAGVYLEGAKASINNAVDAANQLDKEGGDGNPPDNPLGDTPPNQSPKHTWRNWTIVAIFLAVLAGLMVGYAFRPNLESLLFGPTSTPNMTATLDSFESKLRAMIAAEATPPPQPANLPMLPPLDSLVDFSLSPDHSEKFAFLTPTKGRYYFSITIDATFSNDIDIDVEAVNQDGEDPSKYHEKNSNKWEFYPIKGGEYNVVIFLMPEAERDNIDFRFNQYSFRAITCAMRINQDHNSPNIFGVFATAGGNILTDYNGYSVTTGVVANVIDYDAEWYEIYFPIGGQYNPEGKETTAWIHEDHVEVDRPGSSDCAYFN